MRIYYIGDKVLKIWSEQDGAMPEDSPKTAINVPYGVIEIDERYNRLLCYKLVRNSRGTPEQPLPDKYYVNDSGQLVETDTEEVVALESNPQKEAYRLSQLAGLTREQLMAHVDGINDLSEAKTYLKKLSDVVLWLVKQSRLDE